MAGYKNYTKFESTPFHNGSKESLNIKVFKVNVSGPIVNRDSGEIVSESIYLDNKFGSKDLVEPIKLFPDSLELFKNLSYVGFKILLYVLKQIQNKTDVVHIYIDHCKEACGYTHHNLVYRGLSELIENQILAKSTDTNVFFINPNVIFMGNKKWLVKRNKK